MSDGIVALQRSEALYFILSNYSVTLSDRPKDKTLSPNY